MEPAQTARRTRVRRLIKVTVLTTAVVLAVFLAAAFGRAAGRPNDEYAWFEAKYGPSRNSEHAEEWILRDYFGNQRGGIFVDVGSYQYKTFSNTYYLDQTLGWSGIAIDAQEEFAADYAKYRPRTKFFSYFVSDRSDAVESLFVPAVNRLVASSDKEFSDRYDRTGRERKVHTITLNDLLGREGVSKFDFMSMDIELGEPKALAGFDIERFKPRLVVVETHPEVRQQLLDYFAAHHYRVVGRYLRADPENLWFSPADTPVPGGINLGHSD
jgi:FkbM family methyltransferase